MADPGTKVVSEDSYQKTVENTEFEITVIEWNDTDLISVDVAMKVDDEWIMLTGEESLDDEPDAARLIWLRDEYLADPEHPRYTEYN